MSRICAFVILVSLIGCTSQVVPDQPLGSRLTSAVIANEGGALIAEGRFAEAEQRYRLAVRQSPGDVSAQLGLATALARQVQQARVANAVQKAEAEQIFRMLLAEHPNALGVLMGAGAGYSALGNSAQAIALFERAVEQSQDKEITTVALRNIATIAYADGQFAEAVKASRKAFDTNPSAVEANRHLSILNPLGLTAEAKAFSALVLAQYGSEGELLSRASAAFAAADDCIQAEQIALRAIEQGKLAAKFRRDARLVVDWCHGKNRLSELQHDELLTWPPRLVAPVR